MFRCLDSRGLDVKGVRCLEGYMFRCLRFNATSVHQMWTQEPDLFCKNAKL
jgi:hypothetical protein